MDALMPALVAVAATEIGGRVQKGVRVFSEKGGMGGVFAALALSSIVYYTVAVIAGTTIGHTMNANAKLLFMAMALAFAGVPMVISFKAKFPEKGGFAGSFPYFVSNQFADASAFILLAITVRTDTPFPAFVGGLFGIMIVAALPLVFGRNWPNDVALTGIRRIIGLILVLLSALMALRALKLI